MTHHLVLRRCIRLKAKGHRTVVAGLHFHFVKIQTAGVHPGRGAGLEPAQGQTQLFQRRCQRRCREHTVRPAFVAHIAHIHAAAQESAGSQHHRLGSIDRFQLSGQAPKTVLALDNICNFALAQVQIVLPLQRVLHPSGIGAPVNLCPQGVHRRAFAQVQHSRLKRVAIRRLAHFAAQCVDLSHQVTFRGAADGGIAGHIAHPVHIDGKHSGAAPQPCRCQSGLDPGMAGADHRHIVCFCKIFHYLPTQNFSKIRSTTACVARAPVRESRASAAASMLTFTAS